MGLGGVRWALRWLPCAGGLEAQDVWLMSALAYCRAVANAVIARRRTQQSDADELHAWHEAVRRERVH